MSRGCGDRVKGGVYMTVATSPFGLPLDNFLLCPAIPVPSNITLPARGQLVVELSGAPCVLDHIGEKYYPNVADFIEEGRSLGFSRRITATTALQLTGSTAYIPVHSRGLILNWIDYPSRERAECPRDKHGWPEMERWADWFQAMYPEYWALRRTAVDMPALIYELEGCSGYWWEDIEGGAEIEGRYVERQIGSTTYHGWSRPGDVREDYASAMIAVLPVGKIEVIDGAKQSAVTYNTLSQNAAIPVEMVDE